MRCRCAKCDHRWTFVLDMPMEVTAFVREIKRMRCPNCNASARHVLLPIGENDDHDRGTNTGTVEPV